MSAFDTVFDSEIAFDQDENFLVDADGIRLYEGDRVGIYLELLTGPTTARMAEVVRISVPYTEIEVEDVLTGELTTINLVRDYLTQIIHI